MTAPEGFGEYRMEGVDHVLVLTHEHADQIGATPISEVADAFDFKGAALDEALRERGLSTSGSADEKRARLAEATQV